MTPAGFGEYVDQLALVDHHVHGPFAAGGDEARFVNALNEGDPEPLRRVSDGYQSQLGFAVRRWCAELLDLPPHVDPATYWNRRSTLGEREVTRRFTRAAAVSDWLVDTGFKATDLLGPAELAQTAGGAAYEVLRLETLAEELIGEVDPAGYADAFASRLSAVVSDRRPAVVAAKTVLAYRGGFDQDLSEPPPAVVHAAAGRWQDRIERGEPARLTDVRLISFGIHAALAVPLPVQFHVGFGDRDLDLRRADPLHLLDFLRTPAADRAPILLLHCYPYEREAGYLAQAFERVHLDVGLALNHVGARSAAVLGRALELAPFTKVLYSSDAFGPAELHYLGARLWRRSITTVLGGWVDAGDWSESDARAVAAMIARGNARRVYALD